MTTNPKVSIIIPLYVIEDRFFRDLGYYNQLDSKNFEVIVVCDKKVNLPKLQKGTIKLLLTKERQTGPAEKRDLAIKIASGSLCAFIDDDAYPHKNWLSEAIPWFKNPDIVAIGGPGVTPPNDTFWQKISGYILESYLCSGEIQHRFYSGERKDLRFVLDWPAYNLIVRTDVLKKVGGYGSTFYGGEDTLLCLKIGKHGKILYNSHSIVYHHRRKFPFEFLNQIKGVGIHRGYFFKKYPETSRSILYMLPITLTALLFLGIVLSIVKPIPWLIIFLSSFSVFVFLGFWSIKRHKRPWLASLIGAFGIIATHMTYGISFLKGLSTQNLRR